MPLCVQVQLMGKTKVAVAALGSDWMVIFDGPAVATTFSALQPGCEYMVRVAARNAAGQGAFSIPLHLTTAPDVPLAPVTAETDAAATVSGGSRSDLQQHAVAHEQLAHV